MVDINEIYKTGDYLRAEDIGNQFWTFTIKSADVKKFNDGTSKIILYFHEWDKGMPLNITNAQSVAALYGHNSNDWVGRQIMLFSTMASFQGKQVPAVRIRAPQQMGQPGLPPQGYQQPPQQPYQPHAPVQAHPAPRPVGAIQPGQPAPLPTHLQNSPQRPLQPQAGYSELNPPPPSSYDQ